MIAYTSSTELREALRAYVAPNLAQALFTVALDFAAYFLFVAIAVMGESPWLRTIGSIGAGAMIAALFVLGHDAAHNSLTASSRLNRVLAYLLLLPALHNYTLWRLQHNRLHHRNPNVQHLSSWSPLSPQEYLALSPSRRWLEQFHRSGVGFAAYYIVYRWWQDKLFPNAEARLRFDRGLILAAWRDLAIVLGWLAVFMLALVLISPPRDSSSYAEVLFFGWLLPFLVWNHMIGQTVYYHHTHPRVPWFRSVDEMNRVGGQEHVTVYLRQPLWWDHMTHYVADHPAHHVNPMIPHNRLRAAQRRVLELMGSRAIVETWSLRLALRVLRQCKLYDYEAQCWTDFEGRPTSARIAECATDQ